MRYLPGRVYVCSSFPIAFLLDQVGLSLSSCREYYESVQYHFQSMQASYSNDSSDLSVRHQIVAPNAPGSTFDNHPYFLGNPSDISRPVISHEKSYFMMLRRLISSSESPSTAHPYSRPTARLHRRCPQPRLGGLAPLETKTSQSC